ncbi:MAG: M1 family metallopeptidase [Vicinamibacterales bacterium]
MRVMGLLAVLLPIGCAPREAPSPMPDPEPGIPLSLATQRAEVIRDLSYAIAFDLPDSASEPVTGRAAIRFTLRDASQPLVLDFAPGAASLLSLALDGAPVPFTTVNEHIVIPAELLDAREMVVEVEFRAGDAALNRNPDFLYSLFVPARAHLTFPCFDQPDLKARYTLALTMPEDWVAVANGAEQSRNESAGRVTVHYAETKPIPTYLFAFAAGRFQVESADRHGRRFQMLHRETDVAKVRRNRETIFDLHASALEWLEDYTGIPYPFDKFDFVMVPSFQFSGMEHPGAILYNASSMLLDPSATENQMLSRASTIAHETAHMWFGDLVTMRWFDDVWMKEVFANFMAAKIVNPSFPTVNHDLRFLLAHYPAAYAVDRTLGTHPIRQPLDNLSQAGSQYGAIIYQKAPIVMRQLERLVGALTLRDGLRQYLTQFAFANATWLDLVHILDDRSDRDLAAWSKVWVEEAGRPIIDTTLQIDAKGTLLELALTQRDGEPTRSLRWTEAMEVIVGTDAGVSTFGVELNGERAIVSKATGLRGVRFVLPTGGGLAYGEVVLDERSRAYLLRSTPDLSDPLTRGAVWVTLWEELLARRVAPEALVTALLAALPREDVQQNAQFMIGSLREAYWRFLPPRTRAALAPVVERVMRAGIARGKTASAKSAYFNGFRSTVLTPAGLRWLERVWSRAEQVPGLPLAEPDEATLALELAVRDVPDAASILTRQHDRMTNPDRKARFAFVMPALDASPQVRQRFFEALADVANRRREPWVIEGLSYLHHPLRAADSARFVLPALEHLAEIRRTGDIFFPKNWMDATLGGYQSPDVARIVRQFLDDRPDYPIRLRRIILQSADDLFRAAEVVR